MKRTKRQENAIVINFVLYFILFILFLILLLNYIKPNIMEVEDIKSETNDIYNSILDIEKSWLSFSDFKSNSKKDNLEKIFSENKDFNSDYILGIVDSLDRDFYDKNFKNTWNWNYEEFLKNLQEKQKSDMDIEKKLLVLEKILPSYSESIYEINWEDSLTDFKFINYIESIFLAFNLSYNNSIWIKNLTLLPDYVIWVWDNSLDKNIFYIPIEFDLEWSKLSIINFLHFVENVGKISIKKPLWEDGQVDKEIPWELEIYREKYDLSSEFYNFKNIKLSNDEITKDYNIFNNQVFSIESISFSDYINSSFEISNRKVSFLQFLNKTNQLPERFKLKVKLRFYVKWQPKYKIENFVVSFKSKFTETLKEVKELIKNKDLSSSDNQKLKNILNTLNSLKKSLKSLNIKSKDKNLTDIYDKAYKFNNFLDKEIEKINKIKEKIWNTTK